MRLLLSSISVYGFLSLAALPVFAAEDFAIDLADIQSQISELETLVSPSDSRPAH